MKENELNCKIMFDFFSKNNTYELIIKLHPNEKQRRTIYHKWNKKYNNIVKIVRGKEDTQEIIQICNMLIVKHSTIASEAILMNK